jgi:DNA-binding LacI/PurR family transcriptional regulator
MAITIDDVAQAASVSLRTASRAINNKPNVHPKTRQRVLEAAARLNYRPNTNARSLVLRRTNRLGVILPDSRNTVYSEIATSIETRAQARGFDCFFMHSEGQAEREARFLDLALDRTVDGLVVFPNFLEANRSIYSDLLQNRFPLVLRGAPRSLSADVDYVTVDLEHGGYLATRHLLTLGHVNIGILISEFALGHHHGRLRGYERAHQEKNLVVQPDYQAHCSHRLEDGYLAVQRLLETHPEITALFCHNDYLAMTSFRAARETGRSIPEDLAVIGFDDIDMGRFYEVPLTSVNHPKDTEGEMLADIVCNRIEQPDQTPYHVTLKPELVIRESCGYGRI